MNLKEAAKFEEKIKERQNRIAQLEEERSDAIFERAHEIMKPRCRQKFKSYFVQNELNVKKEDWNSVVVSYGTLKITLVIRKLTKKLHLVIKAEGLFNRKYYINMIAKGQQVITVGQPLIRTFKNFTDEKKENAKMELTRLDERISQGKKMIAYAKERDIVFHVSKSKSFDDKEKYSSFEEFLSEEFPF